MGQSYVAGDLYVAGTVTGKQNIPSAGSVGDAQVVAGANIQATKLQHQYAPKVDQQPGTNVVSATNLIHQVFASGTGVSAVAGFETTVVTPPTGADYCTIDLQRSTGGGAFASVLTSPITINSSTPALTPQTASIASGSLNGGDILRVVVTPNHSSGTLPQGLISQAFIRENPQ